MHRFYRDMGTLASTSEIVESKEEEDSERRMKNEKKYSIEDDINRLFQAIEIRSSTLGKDPLRKSAMKRPMRVCSSPSSGIGISEHVSLKQALRGLCISQASEMAAMKRLSKLTGSSGLSEAGNIKRLYRAVVVEANSSGLPMISQGKGNFVEISLVPEKIPDSAVITTLPQQTKIEIVPCQTNSEAEEIASTSASKISKPGFIFRGKRGLKSNNPKVNAAEKEKASRISLVRKVEERPISREKGEFSQSSAGEYSTCTSTSEESSLSGSGRGGKRPHMSRDSRWEAIRRVQKQNGSVGLSHFKLIRRLGCGDIGTVYLAELTGTSCLFALKVMDNELLETRKKISRAQTEREVLEMLDHPFLPTLFAHFVSGKLSCLVMEYCPGGDLHVLRQKQPTRSFSEQAARFYVAEVLVALEYLHMLGVVYRDLKPENILVREDGHIMLSDFDLSLRGDPVDPTVVKPSWPVPGPATRKTSTRPCTESACIDPLCLHPAWHVSCFAPKLSKPDPAATQVSPVLPPELVVVEPTGARSNSFVGTHEYLAPEIVKGEGHGSAVDWWTFGVFLYELLYGKTPFKGSGNEDTLANVVSKGLRFPETPMVSFHARDLIRGLLVKDPASRFGSVKGAAEIKRHPFFDGLNWALIRCSVPPELPKFADLGTSVTPTASSQKPEGTKCTELEVAPEFEVF